MAPTSINGQMNRGKTMQWIYSSLTNLSGGLWQMTNPWCLSYNDGHIIEDTNLGRSNACEAGRTLTAQHTSSTRLLQPSLCRGGGGAKWMEAGQPNGSQLIAGSSKMTCSVQRKKKREQNYVCTPNICPRCGLQRCVCVNITANNKNSPKGQKHHKIEQTLCHCCNSQQYLDKGSLLDIFFISNMIYSISQTQNCSFDVFFTPCFFMLLSECKPLKKQQ